MQHVIEETVLFVPKAVAVLAAMVHRARDVQEVFPEFAGNVFVSRVVAGKLDRDRKQIECVHRHPARTVGLLDVTAGRKRCTAIEYTDVVEPKKAALEDVHALRVFAVHPPGEVQHQLVKHFFEKANVSDTAPLLLDFVNAPCRPGMHRRIHIAKGPFISW